ncbi:MAG: FAD-dependent oxidoreductase, partial [Muribaculaceae bacterium]|nr:FAD-dependent oxidoreductase [Muribaculaceae bacterium]
RGENINIGKLERFVADFDSDAGLTHDAIPEKTRGKVAVIGSGPAGLTIAGDLARKGFAIEIFEMEPDAGGVLMFGIPEYRLPKEVVRREIKRIENLGVIFHLATTIGEEITIDDLFERGFDAIFMGTGTGVPKRLKIPGINNKAVRQAIRFLRRVSLYENGLMSREEVIVGNGDRVFVIGCGNTGIDAARTAVRMGSKEVTVIYHRSIDEMTALRSEYDEAVAEGVKFLWSTSVTGIEAIDDEHIRSVTLITAGVEKTVPADHVIMAVGSEPAARIVSSTKGIEIDENGYVLTRDVPYGMSTRAGVFAGGDVTKRSATVVHAMHDAKLVAEGIIRYVDAKKLLEAINGGMM